MVAAPIERAPLFYVKDSGMPEDVLRRMRDYNPRSELGKLVRECLWHLPTEMAAELLDRISSVVIMESSLALVHFHPLTELGRKGPCEVNDLGIVRRKLVTNNGVGFIVDAFQNLVELEIMKYHGIGTGTTAEAQADSALVTESTTALNPDSTRATGNLTEGASANIFHTEGTLTVDANAAITEHGVFSTSGTGTGVLLDRSVFAAVNLVGASGDSLLSKYELTVTAGG